MLVLKKVLKLLDATVVLVCPAVAWMKLDGELVPEQPPDAQRPDQLVIFDVHEPLVVVLQI